MLALLVFHVNFMEFSGAPSDGDWGKRFKIGNPCSAAAQMVASPSNNLGTCPKAILEKLKLQHVEAILAMGQIENTIIKSTHKSSGPKQDEVGSKSASNAKEDPLHGNECNEFPTQKLYTTCSVCLFCNL